MKIFLVKLLVEKFFIVYLLNHNLNSTHMYYVNIRNTKNIRLKKFFKC